MKREIQNLIHGHAAQAVYDRAAESSMSEGAEVHSEVLAAPGVGGWASLSKAPLVPDTLELVGPDDALYMPDTDYYEDPSAGRFQNLTMPEGAPLAATYHYEEAFTEAWSPLELDGGWVDTAAGAGEPATYREGSRAYARGVVMAGATAVGTAVCRLSAGYRPAAVTPRMTMSDAGPVMLEIFPTGEVEIADGPFECGSLWLALDGLSWRWEPQTFASWGDTHVTFADLDEMSYGGLS